MLANFGLAKSPYLCCLCAVPSSLLVESCGKKSTHHSLRIARVLQQRKWNTDSAEKDVYTRKRAAEHVKESGGIQRHLAGFFFKAYHLQVKLNLLAGLEVMTRCVFRTCSYPTLQTLVHPTMISER